MFDVFVCVCVCVCLRASPIDMVEFSELIKIVLPYGQWKITASTNHTLKSIHAKS